MRPLLMEVGGGGAAATLLGFFLKNIDCQKGFWFARLPSSCSFGTRELFVCAHLGRGFSSTGCTETERNPKEPTAMQLLKP